MQTFMHALCNCSIQVQNFKATPNTGISKTSGFGYYAVSAFFLGLGALTGKKNVSINIDGEKLVSINKTIQMLDQMSETELSAINRLGKHINQNTCFLFGSNSQLKYHINIYATQLLLNQFPVDSLVQQINLLFADDNINKKIATSFLDPQNLYIGGCSDAKALQLISDNLAQMAEAAESIGQSLLFCVDILPVDKTAEQQTNNWPNLAKHTIKRICALLNSNNKQRAYTDMPSCAAMKWYELQSFFKTIHINITQFNGGQYDSACAV